MNIKSHFTCVFNSIVRRRIPAMLTLIALAWTSIAFCERVWAQDTEVPSGSNAIAAATTEPSSEAQQTAESLCKEAASLLDQGKTNDALAAFEKAIATAPRRGETWMAIADSQLYQRHAQPEAWDALITAHPSSPFPRLFKGSSYYGWGKLAQADAELTAAQQLGPNDALVWSFCYQVHTLEGRYDEAFADYGKYLKFGGFKPLEATANRFGSLLACLNRQLHGDKLPPADWQAPKDFSATAEISNAGEPFLFWLLNANGPITDPKVFLGDTKAKSSFLSNKFYTCKGSKDEPVAYAPNLYMWDASILVTAEYGILLGNGSKLKHVSVVHGIEQVQYGAVKNWQFVFETGDESVAKPATPPSK